MRRLASKKDVSSGQLRVLGSRLVKRNARQTVVIQFYEAMAAHFGPLNWWPAENDLEVAVGAVLTQNTAWRNVEKALVRLRDKNALRLDVLWAMPPEELEACLIPSGYYRLKTKRLRSLLAYFTGHAGWDATPEQGGLGFLGHKSSGELRKELLALRGIGQETADAILLYALHRPSFVVDAYTRRIFHRHGLLDENISYEDMRSFFMEALPMDVKLYNEYHALIVRTGNVFCKKKDPLCEKCPLGKFIDHAAI